MQSAIMIIRGHWIDNDKTYPWFQSQGLTPSGSIVMTFLVLGDTR
jgi:hypothetical protein